MRLKPIAYLEKTFEQRQTEVPNERPPGLFRKFANDTTRSALWLASSEATQIEGMTFAQIVDDIWTTLEPIRARADTARYLCLCSGNWLRYAARPFTQS